MTCLVCGGACGPHICAQYFQSSEPTLMGDRASIVAFLRREYHAGPWQGTTVFLILADAIEREVDREDLGSEHLKEQDP